jgi:hypothetical protein
MAQAATAGYRVREAPVYPVFLLVRRPDLPADMRSIQVNLALQDGFLTAYQQALPDLVQQDVGGLVGHAQVATHLQGRNALHGVGKQDHGRQVQAQRQLVESEERPGGGGEIFLAAGTAPNRADRAEVVPVRHAAVRADHFLAFAPARVAEQGKRLIVTHRQDLNHRQGTGFGFQQEMQTRRTGSWGWVMSRSLGGL